MIAVVDYGSGNLYSIARALEHLGAGFAVANTPQMLGDADGVILPGVGAFGDAMEALRRMDLVEPLRQAARRGTPLLGICLGMQLLFSRSAEFGDHRGLGLIPGEVRRLPPPDNGADTVRIPNVGWREVRAVQAQPLVAEPLLAGATDAMYYFVHSYAPVPDDPTHVAATLLINGAEVAVAVRRDNLAGVQFHPEKSGLAGLALLGRFVASATDRRAAG